LIRDHFSPYQLDDAFWNPCDRIGRRNRVLHEAEMFHEQEESAANLSKRNILLTSFIVSVVLSITDYP